MSARRGPIFVLGAPFSGASLLSWALAQHPNIRHGLESKWLVGLAAGLDGLWRQMLLEPQKSCFASGAVSESRFYQAMGGAVSGLYLEGREEPRWLDCTPGHVFYVAGLRRLFPDASFLHVVRGAREVASALTGWPSSDGACYTAPSALRLWCETVEAGLEAERAYGSEAVLRLRFADLAGDTEAALRHCLAFLGEQWDPACQRPFEGLELECSREPIAGGEDPEVERLERAAQAEPQRHCPPDPDAILRLDRAFSQAADRGLPGRETLPLSERVREAVRNVLPPDARLAVISKGDDSLVDLAGRSAWHFPQNHDGVYAGFHPRTSAEAVSHLEDLRRRGREYLLVPRPYFWWLECYEGLRRHLEERARLVFYQEDCCLIYDLRHRGGQDEARLKLEYDESHGKVRI